MNWSCPVNLFLILEVSANLDSGRVLPGFCELLHQLDAQTVLLDIISSTTRGFFTMLLMTTILGMCWTSWEWNIWIVIGTAASFKEETLSHSLPMIYSCNFSVLELVQLQRYHFWGAWISMPNWSSVASTQLKEESTRYVLPKTSTEIAGWTNGIASLLMWVVLISSLVPLLHTFPRKGFLLKWLEETTASLTFNNVFQCSEIILDRLMSSRHRKLIVAYTVFL